jgi:hypothetical protein
MVCAVEHVILAVVAGVKGVDVSGFLILYQLLDAAVVVFKSCYLLVSQPVRASYQSDMMS